MYNDNEAAMLFEVGVYYCRPHTWQKPISSMTEFHYHWVAPDGRRGTSSSYCHSTKDLQKLLNWWSRAGWSYFTTEPLDWVI